MENVTYYYPEKEEAALVDIRARIQEGEFIFLTGPSGCGKSSLLRALSGLLPDYYGGSFGGEIRFDGRSLGRWDKRQLARNIGLVFQDPEQQLVMTSVEQEIAFGLENLGIRPAEMRRRVAEVMSLFDLTALKTRSTFNLSGGQQQKVVLAAVLAMYPRVLLLDEPTSQLDPVAAQELLNYIQRLNLEWGLTVILVEQRTDRCFHLADRVFLMEEGRITHQGPPRDMAGWGDGRFRIYLPPVAQVFSSMETQHIPLTIKEGRQLLRQQGWPPAVRQEGPPGRRAEPGDASASAGPSAGPSASVGASAGPSASSRAGAGANVGGSASAPAPASASSSSTPAPLVRLKDVEFAYGNNPSCLREINLAFYPGQLTVILGENGAGKSTLLKVINGLLKPQRGRVFLQEQDVTGQRAETLSDRIGFLSQDPNDYLFHDTVQEEVGFGLQVRGRREPGRVEETLQRLEIAHLARTHPRDASGGERQRIALASVLVTDPPVLLLDEPTRGLDTLMKGHLAGLLKSLQEQGKTVVVVTHDVEFAAEVGGRVVILSDGQVVADGSRDEVLSDSLYYAPQVNRLFRGLAPGILTVRDAIEKLKFLARGVG